MPQHQHAKIPVHTRGLGTELLAFILNIDASTVDRLLADGANISNEQKTALDLTNRVVSEIKKERTLNQVFGWQDMQALVRLSISGGQSVLSWLRVEAGGDFELLESEDPAKQILAEMCVECFPYTLLPIRNGPFEFGKGELSKCCGSDKLEKFMSAMRGDNEVTKLFPNLESDSRDQSRQYYSSFGQGGTFQLKFLPVSLIQAGIALMHVKNESSMTALQRSAWEMLDALRDSLAGKKPSLYVIDIFDLVGLPEDFQVSLGQSKLSGIPIKFFRHIPYDARPRRSGIGQIYGCMLQRPCSYEIAVNSSDNEPDLNGEWPIEVSHDGDMKQRNIVSLATSLSFDNEYATAARWRATVTIDPLYGVGQRGSKSRASLAGNYFASSDECNKLTELLGDISNADTSSIELAIDRYLKATINRSDWQDSLIDSVIGLENLFGQRNEISFSVASGVANLLGSDLEERKCYFEKSKRIYSARSKLVHGSSKNVANLDIPDLGNSALDLLRKCILKLIKIRPDLLKLSAGDRVKTLVLS